MSRNQFKVTGGNVSIGSLSIGDNNVVMPPRAELDGEAEVTRRRTVLWQPGDYRGLAALVDRDAVELSVLRDVARRALGRGFGEQLTAAFATGVRDVARAIYEAVRCSTDIRYDYEPANPGEVGQQVRLAAEVLAGSAATCLDLELLYAALLEGAHVSPAIVVVERQGRWHALGGFFDRTTGIAIESAAVMLDDVHKLVRAKELILVETTGLSVTKGEKKSFERACEEAIRQLDDARPLALVDVVKIRSEDRQTP